MTRPTQEQLIAYSCALLDASSSGDDSAAATGVLGFAIVVSPDRHDLELLVGTLLVIGGELTKMLAEGTHSSIDEVLKAAVESANKNASGT